MSDTVITYRSRPYLSTRSTNVVPQAQAPAGYTTTGVAFNGSTNYAEKGTADLTGLADTQAFLMSFWFRIDGGAGGFRLLLETSDQLGITAGMDNTNKINVSAYSPGYTHQLYTYQSSMTFAADGTWHHFMGSTDGSGTNVATFIDGVDDSGFDSLEAFAADYANTTHTYTLGARSGGSLFWNGALADIFFTNEYLDFQNSTNRLKFRTAGGKPEDLGLTGTTPTGTAPKVLFRASPFHSEVVNAFHTNKGTGGGMTLTGTLSAAASNPSD